MRILCLATIAARHSAYYDIRYQHTYVQYYRIVFLVGIENAFQGCFRNAFPDRQDIAEVVSETVFQSRSLPLSADASVGAIAWTIETVAIALVARVFYLYSISTNSPSIFSSFPFKPFVVYISLITSYGRTKSVTIVNNPLSHL